MICVKPLCHICAGDKCISVEVPRGRAIGTAQQRKKFERNEYGWTRYCYLRLLAYLKIQSMKSRREEYSGDEATR